MCKSANKTGVKNEDQKKWGPEEMEKMKNEKNGVRSQI
jgi:hypothetical protein